MNEQVNQVLEYCIDHAKFLLEHTFDFDPFAAYLDRDELLNLLEYNQESKTEPLSGQVIDFLTKTLVKEFNNNTIQVYALVYEVSMQIEKDQPQIDAIAIDIVHHTEKQIPIFYLPYQIKDEESVIFSEAFAVKR